MKFDLAGLTFVGLVVPTALLMSIGVPEEYVLPLMLVAILPFQYVAFCFFVWQKEDKTRYPISRDRSFLPQGRHVTRPRVLLVMPSQRRLGLLPILEQNGMEVEVAVNFRDGQQKLNEQAYDLLFVDAELPGGPWYRLHQIILASGKNCEVIVCSGRGDERFWAEVLQCGAYDLITEPYDEHEIVSIIQRVMDSLYLRRFGREGLRPSTKLKA